MGGMVASRKTTQLFLQVNGDNVLHEIVRFDCLLTALMPVRSFACSMCSAGCGNLNVSRPEQHADFSRSIGSVNGRVCFPNVQFSFESHLVSHGTYSEFVILEKSG